MKKTLIALILISLIFLSGITGCPSTTTKTETASEGLDVQFSKDSPPVSVNVNQEFPIHLDVLNKGGDYVQKGDAKFYLTGISNLENVKASMVNDRTFNKESMSPDKVIFADKARFTFPLQSLLVMPVALTYCYGYGTTSQANICIAGSNQSEVCSVSGEKITSDSNSVSPVQVSSLTEEVVGNKLRLSFTISNKLENGQVYLSNVDCDKLLQARDYAEAAKKNKVNIEIRTPEKGLTCKLQENASPFNTIDAINGVADVGRVVCEKPLSSDDHVSPLYIILRYKYVSSITKSINVLP